MMNNWNIKRSQFLMGLGLSLAFPIVASADWKDSLKEPSLQGVVVNAEVTDIDPVVDAAIKVEGTEISTVSNDKGVYILYGIPDGSYNVTFVKDGYQPVTKTIKIKKGPTPVSLNVAMVPDGISIVGNTPIGGGTIYIAYAERNPNQANTFNSPMQSSARTLEGALIAGADPSSLGQNLPAEMKVNDQSGNPTTTDKNTIMILPPNSPGRATFSTMSTRPLWMAFNRTGTHLYISSLAQMIMVYDAANGMRLLKNLPAMGAVTDMSLSLDGRYVLASVMAASRCGVMLIDTNTQDPAAYLPLPGPPRSSVMAGNLVFSCTGDGGSGLVYVMDSATAVMRKTIKVGNQPTGLAIAPNGRYLFCVNSGSASLSVIDCASLNEIAKIPVGVNPQKVAVSPDSSRVFVTNKQNNTVSVIDGNSLSGVATVQVGAGPIGITVNRDGSKAYVACKDAGTIMFLNGKTGAAEHTTVPMPLSSPWGVVVRP
jgi:YVTN family beta-propeller protein